MPRNNDVSICYIIRHEILWPCNQDNDIRRISIFNGLRHTKTNRVFEQLFGDIDNVE